MSDRLPCITPRCKRRVPAEKNAGTADDRAIGPDDPVRLATAASIAFPDGSMTESGLRKEWRRDRLDVYVIAGKQYTTLRSIREMIERCRAAATQKVPVCGSNPNERNAMEPSSGQSGVSATTEDLSDAQDSALRAVKKLKMLSASTSQTNGTRTVPATVVPLK